MRVWIDLISQKLTSLLTQRRPSAAAACSNLRAPVHEAGGQIDIETLKDQHWALAEREALYRQLLDSQDHLIAQRDGSGCIVFANAAYRTAFGLAMPVAGGSSVTPRVLASEAEQSSVTAAGKGCRAVVELVTTSRGPRWIRWEHQRVASQGEADEVLSIGRDVTKERAHEDQLREACLRAEAANRAKSRFLAAMSHEIRTPMNGIIGMAALLGDTGQSSEQRSYTEAVSSSAKALLAVIDEILDFSSIEAGKLRLADRPFSLAACVRDAVALLQPRASDKGITLEAEIADGCGDRVSGDEDRLRQILLNLLSNAVKFTDRGGVHVEVSRLETGLDGAVQDIVVTVADTGIGFDTAHAERLFDEFEQSEEAVGRGKGGTGLGLAIARRLARAMGGDITAVGKPGEGATFTATLRLRRDVAVPADAAASVEVSRSSPQPVPPLPRASRAEPPAPPRVLIAEDNEINAVLARRVVEKAGCEAIVVSNGRSAVATVASAVAKLSPPIDLVLMDLYMPDLDGLAATRTILGFPAMLGVAKDDLPPIVALTANAFAEDRLRCLGAGMVDYLAKPFDVGHLGQLLERWVFVDGARRNAPRPLRPGRSTPPAVPLSH